MSSELYNEIETLYNKVQKDVAATTTKVLECMNKNEKPELPLSVETAHELINKQVCLSFDWLIEKQTNEIISLSNEKLQYDNKINELEKEIKELIEVFNLRIEELEKAAIHKVKVQVTEYLQKVVEVDAINVSDACDKVEEMVNGSEIILTADDFTTRKIEPYEDK